ncbi:hypothetical protein MVEN_01641200 [Mycena venus]|uniref:Uncharacterized protein n=1 Tax=Mycena venus TaxID=2733690 RepID=A0A8H7CQS3_9AGAR|nr:hypothetical protein MVEN_01641200 [Mycena venus]
MASTLATLNGPCKPGDGLAPGVGACVHTSTCNAHGGTIHNNLCPGDGDDVKCCTNWEAPKCDARRGLCRFTNTCDPNESSIVSDLCPGPNDFKCCIHLPSLRSVEAH